MAAMHKNIKRDNKMNLVRLRRQSRPPSAILRGILTLCGGLSIGSTPAVAGVIDIGNPDVNLRWDNTFKYSAARRLDSPLSALTLNPNNDDGDRNFAKGLISNRFDLLSELDLIYKKNMGLRISAAAWNDSVYGRSNANPGFAGGAVPNHGSVPYNRFTRGTRDVHGDGREVLDAFVFGNFDVNGKTISARAGRHSVLWGESLFFGANAIAGTQMPVDVVKLISVPSTPFKEGIRPVPMVSGQVQITQDVSVGAYVQFASSRSRLPASGSYFSNTDYAVDGAEGIYFGPGAPAPRFADMQARDSGQGGVQLKMHHGDTDYGFYLIRFHNKLPQIVPKLGMTPVGPAPMGYYIAYQENIKAFGASASRTFGDYNVASELSLRTNQDLASTQGFDTSALAPVANNNSSNPAYAIGRTAHLNISVLGSVPRNFLWNEATIVGEIAWNRVLSVSKNGAAVDPNATRDGVALRAVFEAKYRQVLPGLDLGVPIGIGYAPKGSRPMAMTPNAWVPEGGGDITVGLNGAYQDTWNFGVNYTHYYGDARTFNTGARQAFGWGQTLRDRDFVSFTARATF
jgi:hypothetical protein